MRIVLLSTFEGDVIAREDQFGSLEAEFILSPDEQVFYRHPLDSRIWFAGSNINAFRRAATAWNRYCDKALGRKSEEAQQEAVVRLQTELSGIGVLSARSNNLWVSLVEQANEGLL